MADTTAWSVSGCQLAVMVGTAYTNIPGVTSFSLEGGTKPAIDVTAISDTSKQYVQGTPDSGTAQMDLAWRPTDSTHVALKTSFDNASGPTDQFKVYLKDTDNSKAYFNAQVNAWSANLARDSAGTVRVSAKLTGAINVTTA